MNPLRLLPITLLASALVATVLVTVRTTAAAAPADAPTRVREVHVPYREFHRLKREHPEGVVMGIAEYRQLVLRAIAQGPPPAEPELPPVASAILDAQVTGEIHDDTLRLETTLRVRVTQEGWVRCDLGPPLPALGLVTVDGQPGWIVSESPPPARSKEQKRAAPRSSLLLEGEGEHVVRLVHSVRTSRDGDDWHAEGRLVPGW